MSNICDHLLKLNLPLIVVFFFLLLYIILILYNEYYYFLSPEINKYKKQTALLPTNLDSTFEH